MGDIYRQAKRALVWLGQDNDDFGEIALSVQQVIGDIREKTNGFKRLKSTIYNKSGFLHDGSQFQLGAHMEKLVKLYNRPWFSRLWVVQEITLSTDCVCICGRHEVPWTDVLRIAAWLQYVIPQQHGTSRLDCPGIDNATIMWQYSEREFGLYGPGQIRELSLGNLLANSRHFKASDARDKVYGLLALTAWSMNGRQLPLEITPDYRKSFVHVYRDATKLAIQEKQNLHILRYVLASTEEAANDRCGFPSWVPRWDKRAQPFHARPLPRVFSAGQARKMLLKANPDLNCLDVLGSVFDHVSGVSDVIDDMSPEGGGVARLLSSLHGFIDKPGPYITGEPLLEAIALTMIAGTINKHVVDRNALSTQGNPLDLKSVGALIKSGGDSKTQYAKAYLQACLNRRFFVTHRGYFGLGPQNMQRNDVVSILFGGSTPYVLRSDDTSHLFIGECYVHGIMFGEGIEAHKVPQIGEISFEIR